MSTKYLARVSRLIDACFVGDLAVVNEILNYRRGRDFSRKDTQRALRAACIRGHHLVVDRLLKDRRCAPSNDQSRSCNEITMAYSEGYVKVVERLLLDYRTILSGIPDIANACLRSAIMYNHTAIINRIVSDPYFDRFLSPSAGSAIGQAPYGSNYLFVSLNGILRFASTFNSSALNTLLKDMRILFARDNDFGIVARRELYKKRAIDMQELHEELVATVACRHRD